MVKTIKSLIGFLVRLDRATDIIPLILSYTLINDSDYDEEDEEEADNIHFGLVSMAIVVALFVWGRIALSMLILLLF